MTDQTSPSFAVPPDLEQIDASDHFWILPGQARPLPQLRTDGEDHPLRKTEQLREGRRSRSPQQPPKDRGLTIGKIHTKHLTDEYRERAMRIELT